MKFRHWTRVRGVSFCSHCPDRYTGPRLAEKNQFHLEGKKTCLKLCNLMGSGVYFMFELDGRKLPRLEVLGFICHYLLGFWKELVLGRIEVRVQIPSCGQHRTTSICPRLQSSETLHLLLCAVYRVQPSGGKWSLFSETVNTNVTTAGIAVIFYLQCA